MKPTLAALAFAMFFAEPKSFSAANLGVWLLVLLVSVGVFVWGMRGEACRIR